MATILMIHGNRLVSGVQYPGISSLSAFAKKAGHNFVFFDTAHYAPNRAAASYKNFKERVSRIDLEFKHIKNKAVMPIKKPITELLSDLGSLIRANTVDVIGVSSFSDDWSFSLFLIRRLHEMAANIPIIVGGVHATIMPEQVIAHDEVKAVCIGEGEAALVELLDSIDKNKGSIDLNIKSMWIKDASGMVHKNPIRHLLSFDKNTPKLDWTLYDDVHFYYPFEGILYRRGSVFIGRGCPYSCSFCINDCFRRLYGPSDRLLRRKKIDYAIEEIAYLKKVYRLEFLRFWDETFLAMPESNLSTFAEAYAKEIKLPFTIETTAQTINQANARILADMGCQSISVGVETSNEKLRAGILKKPIRNEAYERCFKIIAEYGMRKVANFMFFLPHQSIADMWQDVRLCAKWKIDHPSARIFYPYAGTSLRTYCIKNNMLDTDMLGRIEDEGSIQILDDLNMSYATFQDTLLKVDPRTKEEGMKILKNFILFQETPASQHEYINSLLENKDIQTGDALRKLERDIYIKRFGEEPVVEFVSSGL